MGKTILFWGYCWDEEGRPSRRADDSQDEEERYARAIGITAPVEQYPTDRDLSAAAEAVRQKYHKYRTRKRAAAKAAGCEIIDPGDETMYGVGVTASIHRPWQGSQVRLAPDAFAVDPTWRALLDDYCAKMGIAIPVEGAAWFLVSCWG